MADNVISVDVELAIGKAQQDILALQNQFTAFGVNLTGVMNKADKSMSVFKGTLMALVAEKAMELLAEGAKKLFDTFIIGGVEASAQFGKAVTELNTSLSLAGKYTDKTSASLVAYARSLEETSTADATVILHSMSLIEVLGDLDEKGLKRATKDSLDLAAAMAGRGLSVEAASNLVAKASVGSTNQLARYGIVIDQTGTAAERYARVLTLIESKFGGAAQAQLQSYAGAVQQAKNSFEEMQIATGDAITQNPLVLEAIHMASKAFEELAGWIRDNKAAIKDWISDGILIAMNSIAALLYAVDGMIRGFELVGQAVYGFVSAIVAGAATIAQVVTMGMSKTINKFAADARKDLQDTAQEMKDTWNNKGALGAVSDYVANAAVQLAKHQSDVVRTGGAIRKSGAENAAASSRELLATHNTWMQIVLGESAMKQLEFTAAEKRQALLNAEYMKGATTRTQIEARMSTARTTMSIKEFDQLKKLYDADAQASNALNEAKFNAAKTALTTISSLMQSKNEELFYIGKAAALSMAIINTAQGVTQALAQGGVWGIITGALVGVAGAVQIANIASQNPGFEAGGIVPGQSLTGDKTQANVNSREMIITTQQQAGLFDFIKQGSQGGGGGGDTYHFYDTVVDSPARIDQLISKLNQRVRSGTPMLATRTV